MNKDKALQIWEDEVQYYSDLYKDDIKGFFTKVFALGEEQGKLTQYDLYSQVVYERDEYKLLAESWMNDYDKLKEKYEPLMIQLSRDKEPLQ